MAYPDDLRVDGERVALHTHRHWRTCVGPAAGFLLAVAVAAFGAAVIRRQPWAPVGWLFWPVSRRWSRPATRSCRWRAGARRTWC